MRYGVWCRMTVDEAVAAYRADLDPHDVVDCYAVAYNGQRNPKNEPRLYEPATFRKQLVVLRIRFHDQPQEQTRVLFVDK